MLGHRDLDIHLVGIWWTPPATPATGRVLGYRYPVARPEHHWYAEIGGAVAVETAMELWLERATYFSRNKTIEYVRHTPDEVAAMLGAETWEESTEEQRDRLDALLRWELCPNLESYLKATKQTAAFRLDWYLHLVELTWYRRRVGL